MSDAEEELYDIEDRDRGDPPDTHASPQGDRADAPAPAPPNVLDVCPNCGAPMKGRDTLLCLRCGFDLKSNRVMQTSVGKPREADDDHDDGPPAPETMVVREGRGGLWAAELIAGLCAAALLVGYLAGYKGLYSAFEVTAQQPTVPVLTRFTELLRFIAISALLLCCGIVALYILAGILQKTFGDLKLALARMAAVVCVLRLASFIDLRQPYEGLVEMAVQLAIFVGMSMLMFFLSAKDALSLAALTIGVFLAMWVISFMLHWAALGMW